MTKKTTKKDEPSEIPSAPAVFDVSKPGETAAHPTSKPVIVGHTSTLKQDPMVAPISEIDEKEKDIETIAKKSEVVIEPPEADQEEIKSEEDIKTTEEEVPEKIEESEPAEEEIKSDEKDEKIEDKPDSSESGEIDALATEAEAKKSSKTALEQEQKELEKTEELVNSKKYFLPIVEGGKKRSSEIMLLWFLIFLVVITIAAWFVVDAGYYDPGFELPYDFIKN